MHVHEKKLNRCCGPNTHVELRNGHTMTDDIAITIFATDNRLGMSVGSL